jgi:hypothetical protein
MNRLALKKLGRRKARTWGRTHGPTRGNTKRVANKATRKDARIKQLEEALEQSANWIAQAQIDFSLEDDGSLGQARAALNDSDREEK